MTFRDWLRTTGTLRTSLLALALLFRLLYFVINPPSFLAKRPLIMPSSVLVTFDAVWVICSSIIIVECIRVLTFRRTQSLALKKHFAFVLALIVLLGVFKLVTATKTSTHYYNYAWSLSHSQQYAEALRSLDIAITYNPNGTYAYLERAYVHRRLGNYSLALADCNKAIDIAPDYARAYASRGQTYYRLGEYAKALSDFEKAIRLDHRESEALGKWIEEAKKNL